jgi:hypothetical protein
MNELLVNDQEDFPVNENLMQREKTRISRMNKALEFLNKGKSYRHESKFFYAVLFIIISIVIHIALIAFNR